jgi:HSP20 family protein
MPSEIMKFPSFSIFKDEMNKLFDNFLEKGGSSRANWLPLMDISETNENLIIKAEVPGVESKDIDISITGNTLTIKGEKKSEKEEKNKNYHFVERKYGAFSRSVTLPVSVKTDQIKAEYKNGILEISLPKIEKSQVKKIPVKIS